MAGPAADVFVSYKAEDRARVAPLVSALEAEGFGVWWDAHIGGGTNWHEDIEQHLAAAKCVVVAWTRRSVGHDGHFVRDEARRAQRRGAYVPVCLDAVDPPLGFGEIQALPLRGWKGDPADARFRAIADAVRSHISGEPVVHAEHAPFHQPRVSRRAAIAGGAGVAAVAAAGGGWLLLKPSPANARRIAVLPFQNLSGDTNQAYFAEGVAEELRGALMRIGLQVIGRASSDAVKDLDTKAAAAKLGVGNILSGSVRRSSAMVRVSAQLVGGRDGVERWAQSYDRAPGDAIKIQTDIAENVARALSVTLGEAGKAALTLGGTADAAAQDLYLRAEQLATSRSEQDLRESLVLLNAAVARDPNYAMAHARMAKWLEWLGSTYPKNPADMNENFAKAEAAAKRAIALAPKLGPAYANLAQIEADRFDFRSAIGNIKRALLLSPDDPTVLSQGSLFMQDWGDGQRALELADRAIALDPLQGINYGRRGDVLFTLKDYAKANQAWRKAMELTPRLSMFEHVFIANAFILMNQPAKARAELAKLPADDFRRLTSEGILAGRGRDLAAVERIIARLRASAGDAASYQYAEIYAQAGDLDRAFAELDNAFRVKDPGLSGLKVDPLLDPIRRDARYGALLKRLNFPAWT